MILCLMPQHVVTNCLLLCKGANHFTISIDGDRAFSKGIYIYFHVRFLMTQQITMIDKQLNTINIASIVTQYNFRSNV